MVAGVAFKTEVDGAAEQLERTPSAQTLRVTGVQTTESAGAISQRTSQIVKRSIRDVQKAAARLAAFRANVMFALIITSALVALADGGYQLYSAQHHTGQPGGTFACSTWSHCAGHQSFLNQTQTPGMDSCRQTSGKRCAIVWTIFGVGMLRRMLQILPLARAVYVGVNQGSSSCPLPVTWFSPG